MIRTHLRERQWVPIWRDLTGAGTASVKNNDNDDLKSKVDSGVFDFVYQPLYDLVVRELETHF